MDKENVIIKYILINFKEAKSFTKIYVGNGNSIFERFNGIIVPV